MVDEAKVRSLPKWKRSKYQLAGSNLTIATTADTVAVMVIAVADTVEEDLASLSAAQE